MGTSGSRTEHCETPSKKRYPEWSGSYDVFGKQGFGRETMPNGEGTLTGRYHNDAMVGRWEEHGLYQSGGHGEHGLYQSGGHGVRAIRDFDASGALLKYVMVFPNGDTKVVIEADNKPEASSTAPVPATASTPSPSE